MLLQKIQNTPGFQKVFVGFCGCLIWIIWIPSLSSLFKSWMCWCVTPVCFAFGLKLHLLNLFPHTHSRLLTCWHADMLTCSAKQVLQRSQTDISCGSNEEVRQGVVESLLRVSSARFSCGDLYLEHLGALSLPYIWFWNRETPRIWWTP